MELTPQELQVIAILADLGLDSSAALLRVNLPPDVSLDDAEEIVAKFRRATQLMAGE